MIFVHKYYFAPLIQALHEELLGSQILHADETTLQVLGEDKKCYIWVYRTSGDTERPVILCDYQPSRAGTCASTFLDGFSGLLHTDGYEAYHCKLPPEITVVGCWTHTRRKFMVLQYPSRSRCQCRHLLHCGNRKGKRIEAIPLLELPSGAFTLRMPLGGVHALVCYRSIPMQMIDRRMLAAVLLFRPDPPQFVAYVRKIFETGGCFKKSNFFVLLSDIIPLFCLFTWFHFAIFGRRLFYLHKVVKWDIITIA